MRSAIAPGVERVGAAAADRAERVGEVGAALAVARARQPVLQKDARRLGVGAQQRVR